MAIPTPPLLPPPYLTGHYRLFWTITPTYLPRPFCLAQPLPPPTGHLSGVRWRRIHTRRPQRWHARARNRPTGMSPTPTDGPGIVLKLQQARMAWASRSPTFKRAVRRVVVRYVRVALVSGGTPLPRPIGVAQGKPFLRRAVDILWTVGFPTAGLLELPTPALWTF